MVYLDWLCKQLVAVDATTQKTRLARRPCHSLHDETDADAARAVNSNTSTVTPDTLHQNPHTFFHRRLSTLTCNRVGKYIKREFSVLRYGSSNSTKAPALLAVPQRQAMQALPWTRSLALYAAVPYSHASTRKRCTLVMEPKDLVEVKN